MFSGSIPALVTPFSADGTFDEAAFRDLVDWPVADGSGKYTLTCVRPGFPEALRLSPAWPGAASRAAVDAALTHAGLI